MESQKKRDEAYQKAMQDLVSSLGSGGSRTKTEVPAGTLAPTSVTLPTELTNLLRKQAATSLPMFHGSYKEWPNFKRLYDESKQTGNFSDADNVSRLMAQLGKRPKSYVSALMMDPGNERQIIETLSSIYGQPMAIYNELWADLTRLRNPRMENPQTMIEFVVTLGNLVCNMRMINQRSYLNNPLHLAEIVEKLPLNIREQWADKETNCLMPMEGQEPIRLTLEDLYNFLVPQQRKATLLLAQRVNYEKPLLRNENQGRTNVHNEGIKQNCSHCSQQHRINMCEAFKKLDSKKKQQIVQDKRLCFNCLGKNHQSKDCKSTRTCAVAGCKRRHHTLLHERSTLKEEPKAKKVQNPAERETSAKNTRQEGTPSTSKDIEVEEERTNLHAVRKNKIYFQVIPVTLSARGKSLDTFAFLDHGSSNSLILKDAAEELELHGPSSPLKMLWTNESEYSDPESQLVSFGIKGTNNITHSMRNVRTIRKLSLPRQTLDYDELKEKYRHLRGLPIHGYQNAKPTLLIGLDHPLLLTPTNQRVSKEVSVAAKTPLGWTIHGNDKLETDSIFTCIQMETESLREEIQKFFSTEEFGVKVTTIDERSTEEKVKPTTTTEEVKIFKIDQIPDVKLQLNWCSNWQKLRKAVGYWIFYVRKLQSKVRGKPYRNFVTVSDYRNAEILIIKQTQRESYPQDLITLENNGRVEVNSSIAELEPTLDSDGVIRTTGRLDKARSLPYAVRHPIIIPNKHHVTDLITKDHHERFLHRQLEAVIAAIRLNFWIVNTRSAVKRAFAKCQWCKNQKFTPQAP
ncbi:uncharacterized protein LOC129774035 [Toxorhynchites rutilus septentrionalis]|uniref:uncharacterized protein LOC129774035 n=1 Tax=Toxorhynchites rutilus septentrionalis TaxID=329112 RepID=UPI0024783D1C|nr:uncharacterized protein LOC129774035 [Toxorhynchites rutilus septentrionalis]